MAVARKIKTLLTVNILVFVGIILFSVYCRLQVVEALQDGFALRQRAHLGVPAAHPAVGTANDLHQPL